MKNTAKKIVNIFVIVFFLVPVFASAFSDPLMIDCAALPTGNAPCVGDTITFDTTGKLRTTDEHSGLVFDPSTTYYVTLTATGTGDFRMLFRGNVTDGTEVDMTGSVTDQPLNMMSSGDGNTDSFWHIDDATGGGFLGTVSGICISDHAGGCSSPPPPPPAPSGIDAAVGLATSSFATTFGFSMDGVSAWMWDNLGQPILGSGIGTLYVMRYYWLGFIAISIIVLFAFAYFRFFKR